MFLDFALMKKVAAFADRQPKLKWMNLGPSMEQFSNTMSAQVRWLGSGSSLRVVLLNIGAAGVLLFSRSLIGNDRGGLSASDLQDPTAS